MTELFWEDMPEFDQPSKKPYAKINIAVRNQEDLDELSKLLGQKFTRKTKSAWYPKLEDTGVGSKRWK